MFSSKQRNNKASDLKLVYLYSTIKMMHGPINLRLVCEISDSNRVTAEVSGILGPDAVSMGM